MERKRNQMCILGIVLILLLLAYFGMQFREERKEEQEQKETEQNTVYVTELDEITAFSYDIGSGELGFELQDGVWTYVEDTDFPLAQGYPQQIADEFRRLASTRYIENADEPAAYGLDAPAYKILLTDANGKEVQLYFGNAVGEDYYVMNPETAEIYTVNSGVVADLQYTLDEMAQLDD